MLCQPLSKGSLRDLGDNHVRGVIAIELADLIDHDLESVLHLMSEKLTGTELLTDVHHKIVGFEGETTLHIEVSGDLSQIVLDEDKGA